jgi:hypothetical protein
MLEVVEAYWTDHKPIYFAFKSLDYVPQYHAQYHHIDLNKNSLKDIDNNNKAKIMMKG